MLLLLLVVAWVIARAVMRGVQRGVGGASEYRKPCHPYGGWAC